MHKKTDELFLKLTSQFEHNLDELKNSVSELNFNNQDEGLPKESLYVGFKEQKKLLEDPPYSTNLIADSLLYMCQNGYLQRDALVVIELARGQPFDIVEGFSWEHEVSHGKTSVIFLRYASN